jgi:hypothetical protein
MDLFLEAYMQWFHIGSYRLAGLFSQRGGLVLPTGEQLLVAIFWISNPWFTCRMEHLNAGSRVCDLNHSVFASKNDFKLPETLLQDDFHPASRNRPGLFKFPKCTI